jgi:pyridoxal phosphate enzyme (YggS family)
MTALGEGSIVDVWQRYTAVQRDVAQSCKKAGRDPAEVQILSVSKGHTASAIRRLYAQGVRDFGESYVQEWLEKSKELSDLTDIRWHFIGHLQSNKVKFVFGRVYCIHSVDRMSLLTSLQKAAKMNSEAAQRVLIQVEVDPSDLNKSGISHAELKDFVKAVANSSGLTLCGFMGMGPAESEESYLSSLFSKFVQSARDVWLSSMPSSEPRFSLGMSDDLDVAIACGSTMVRIGTAIFGERYSR